MMNECGLCTAAGDTYRQVQLEELVYAMIPREPMREGHLLLLPKRHAKMEDLTLSELAQLRDLAVMMKNRLLKLYPSEPPYLYSVMDTPHASIPEHFHYHCLPFRPNLRTVLAFYAPSAIQERRTAPRSEIEHMALKLRGEK